MVLLFQFGISIYPPLWVVWEHFYQTPDLGLGLGVDFTFPNNNNNNNNNKNPHLVFHRREGARGLKFGTQT